MYDQSRIALFRAAVVKVVMDAMRVENQRRVAKQQHIIGHDLALPGSPLLCGHRLWHGVIGLGRAYGRLHVIDISDAANPKAVAWFEPEDGGSHNVWVAGDTLYLGDDLVLRTHTSPVQVRTLQAYPPPIRVLIPGNVHRRDPFDASHAPTFAQVEGLVVDEGITFADLKATLTHFANRFFGATRTRFRPSYFPFTEPSAEMDVLCGVCKGGGCSVCKQSGWVEILGSGMVHPAVIESAGLDSTRYTGWAFGLGPARTALARHGIPDIRILYDSDVRFLEQFAR